MTSSRSDSVPVIAGRYAVTGWTGEAPEPGLAPAVDVELGQPVTLAVLPGAVGTQSDRHRVRRQTSRLAPVSHPALATVLDVGTAFGRTIVVCTPLPRPLLARRLELGALSPGAAAAVTADVCDGLAALHGAGIAHGQVDISSVATGSGRIAVLLPVSLAAPAEPRPERAVVPDPCPAADVRAAARLLARAAVGVDSDVPTAARALDARGLTKLAYVLAAMSAEAPPTADEAAALLRSAPTVLPGAQVIGRASPASGVAGRTTAAPGVVGRQSAAPAPAAEDGTPTGRQRWWRRGR